MWKGIGKYCALPVLLLIFITAGILYYKTAYSATVMPPTNVRVIETSINPKYVKWTWDPPDPGNPPEYIIKYYQVQDIQNDNYKINVSQPPFSHDISNDTIYRGCSIIQVRTCDAADVCSVWTDEVIGCIGPDLIVDSISIDNYCANSGYTITAVVKNIGYSDVGVTATRFQVNGSTVCSGVSTGIMTSTTGNNPSRTVSCSVDCSTYPYACLPGTRTIAVTADINNDVTEEDESNNTTSRDFSINNCPDFRVRKYGSAWNNTTVCRNKQQLYQYQVENVGDGSGGYFYNRFYVNNSYVSGQQEFVSSNIAVNGVWPSSPSNSCTGNGAMCWTPSATGNYTVVIKADSGSSANTLDCSSGSGGAVTETDETNNCKAS